MQAIDEHLAYKYECSSPDSRLPNHFKLTLALSYREGRLVMVEYCMLEGVNDSVETAHTLGKLLQGRSVHVNLIPYNTTEVGAQFRSPSPEAIREFHSILRDPYNLKATIRENHGTDIDGACGQLALKNKTDAAPQQKDIEDIGSKTHGTKHQLSSPKKSSTQVVEQPQSYVDSINQFIDRHQQGVGLALLGVSVVFFAAAFARRAKPRFT